MNIKLYGSFKNLFRKLVLMPPQEPPAPPPMPTPAHKRQIVMAPMPEPTPPRTGGIRQNGKGIELPLQPILATLPAELRPRLKYEDAGALTISIPLEKVLAQLSRGVVQMSFGELRQAAPDLFTAEEDRDRTTIPLPLGEILTRLNPALITRRRVQKQVEVPADVASPFDKYSRGTIFSVGPTRPGSVPAAPLTPPQRQTAPDPVAPAALPARGDIAFTPTPQPPTATPPGAPAISAKAPAVPPARSTPRVAPGPKLPAATPPSAPAINAGAPAAPPARSAQAFTPAAQVPAATPAPAPAMSAVVRAVDELSGHPSPAPAAPAAPAPKPAEDAKPLVMGLTTLAGGWPEAVRQELVQLNLVDAKVALPVEIAERALKQGRVAFTWKTLRSWIRPTPLPVVSAHDGTILELPLKVVAPHFLARQRDAGKQQQKVSVDAEIPNLFFGFPQPEVGGSAAAPAASSAPAAPVDTNFYVWDDTSDRAKVQEDDVKHGPSPGTKFVAKYSTPNEVVSRAAALDRVSGALIALPDGLMVASRLSPDLNGDTLAAFLPQIFGKVNQCTKELRMGELNNLNFTVGNVPWKIFRVNAIFFAAFGRVGEPLPTAQLAALAAELDHRPK